MRRTRSTVVGAMTLAVALAGCKTMSESDLPDPFRATPTESDEVLLTVENNDFRDANIFAFWSGVRDRVGFVTGKTTKTFRMKWRSEQMQIGVDFVGQGGYISENVDVWAGDHLNFVIMVGR